ncbi:MAG: flagellar protein [Defluviitaleaceae bacterium]|nr:flagellar protein [Defluviitaleaceae bacterium]
MDAMNCPRCRKVFVKRADPLCPVCMKEEELIYEKVREYVKDHPECMIKEVADACGVTVKRILSYLRDGRLSTSKGMHGELLCSKCNKPILTGRMCEKCILETNFMVQDMKNDAAIKNRGQVYTKRK